MATVNIDDHSGRGRGFRSVLPRQLDVRLDSPHFCLLFKWITWPQPPIRGPGSVTQRLLVSNTNDYHIFRGKRESLCQPEPWEDWGEVTIHRSLRRAELSLGAAALLSWGGTELQGYVEARRRSTHHTSHRCFSRGYRKHGGHGHGLEAWGSRATVSKEQRTTRGQGQLPQAKKPPGIRSALKELNSELTICKTISDWVILK